MGSFASIPIYWKDFSFLGSALPTAGPLLLLGFDASKREAIVTVAYCVNPKCMRRIKPNEEGSPNCAKCRTRYRHRLQSGGAKLLSFDYFVRPRWNYT